jgi:hypothetical protein
MKRTTLIQELIRKKRYKNYLEIGCQYGMSFLPIWCRRKIAVDPMFKIPNKRKLKWLLKNPTNISNRYFEETSDSFFEKRRDLLQRLGHLDIVFVDGLHTFEASLKDVLNSFNYLRQDGIIIMHDCFPPHKAASTPAADYDVAAGMGVPGWNGEWCGDTWKSIVYLKKAYGDAIEAYVINTDYGLGVVRMKKKLNPPFTIRQDVFNEVNRLTYEDLMRDPKAMIDLRDVSYAAQLLREI